MVLDLPRPGGVRRLEAMYDQPITVPTTLVWGERDGALSAKAACLSDRDVSLEAPDRLAAAIRRVMPRPERGRGRGSRATVDA